MARKKRRDCRAAGIDRYPSGSIDPRLDTRMDLLPPRALLAAAAAMKHGLKYERERPDNWKGVPATVHLAHALAHVRRHQSGDRAEDHVAHALNRFLMWGELAIKGGAR